MRATTSCGVILLLLAISTSVSAASQECIANVISSTESTDSNLQGGCWLREGDAEKGYKCRCLDLDIKNTSGKKLRVENLSAVLPRGNPQIVTAHPSDFWVEPGQSKRRNQCFRNTQRIEKVLCNAGEEELRRSLR
jgi:hypothetical protein